MNCYDWAVDEMLEAIKLEGNVAEFHYSLGVSYMMLGEISNAKEAFIKALEIDDNDANSLAYLGYAYIVERDFEKAQENLQKALKIEPDNILAKMNSAKLYFQLKKYETAKEFLQDIIEKMQDDETLNMLAFCYMETGEYEHAMGIFFKLAKIYPKNHIILTNLAKCENICGRKKEALDHIRQALMVYDDY
jgi:Flp pilus assembly protein TadD